MNEQAKRARGQGELSVDNIAAEIGEDALRSLFSAYGNVEAVYLGREPSTNRSRGFATVVMSTDEEADHAQADLDTHPLAGRQVRVWRAAGPTSEYEGEEKLCLYVKGLPTDWTHAELNDFFSNFGVIESAKRLPAKMPDSLIPGIVRFITREDAHRALQASNGQIAPGGRSPLQVRFADSEREKREKRAKQARVQGPGAAMPSQSSAFQSPVGAAPGPTPGNPSMAALGTPGAPVAATPNAPTAPYLAPGAEQDIPTRLHVRNLPPEADELLVYRLFAPYGAITQAKVVTDQATGNCKGYGFVTFRRYSEAVTALSMLNGHQVSSDRIIEVQFAQRQATR